MNLLEEIGNGIPVIAIYYRCNVDFFSPLQQYLGSCIFAIHLSTWQLQLVLTDKAIDGRVPNMRVQWKRCEK